ncbi:tetratricopeptide repeat protein [Woodsholea maritima]|uniref:hypothetical protein n=1 Tax=Woodsholea maritima TaxID=240237 RepID=UPI000377E3F0|nr:hypothetical protein [Woodsholea maritima]
MNIARYGIISGPILSGPILSGPILSGLAALALTTSLSTPVFADPAFGPHIDLATYIDQRGGFEGPAWTLSFEHSARHISTGAVEGQQPQTESPYRVRFGQDYALDFNQERGPCLIDFKTERTLCDSAQATALTNTSFFGPVRRNIDTYVGLSQSGQREIIQFGANQTFERFWLEAAMGVRATQVELSVTLEGDLHHLSRGEERVATLDFTASDNQAALDGHVLTSFTRWASHNLTLHPDILAYITEVGHIPSAMTFKVVSPESPQGRMEHWQLTSATPNPDLPELLNDKTSFIFPIEGEVGDVIEHAAAGLFSYRPTQESFLSEFQDALGEEDPAKALLIAHQEAFHFGPCPRETIGSSRLVCASLQGLTNAGVGNARFEALNDVLMRLGQVNYVDLEAALSPYLNADGHAGAGANLIYGLELSRLAQSDTTLIEDSALSPQSALNAALLKDPMAGDTYWYLAQHAIASGNYDQGWAYLDLARAGAQIEKTPALDQAEAIESRLKALAPGFFLPSEENLQISE